MEKKLKIKLIENLAKIDEGVALKETIEDFISEINSVSEIDSKILNGDEKLLAIEVKGRQIAVKYLQILTKTLKPLFTKEVVKKIIR